MKVKWLGHACFLITSTGGLRIITDPYMNNAGLNYKSINDKADIVTVSHDHADHNNTATVSGQPQIVKTAGVKEVKGIKIKGIPTYHDESKGRERGDNIIFCFTLDNINLCHLGDLGHRLSQEELGQIGQVDVFQHGFFVVILAYANHGVDDFICFDGHGRSFLKCNDNYLFFFFSSFCSFFSFAVFRGFFFSAFLTS